jgi:hypothetical protein
MLDESCVISGFRHGVYKNCALLGYAASSDNFLMMFWDNLSVPHCQKEITTTPHAIIQESAYPKKKDIS